MSRVLVLCLCLFCVWNCCVAVRLLLGWPVSWHGKDAIAGSAAMQAENGVVICKRLSLSVVCES